MTASCGTPWDAIHTVVTRTNPSILWLRVQDFVEKVSSLMCKISSKKSSCDATPTNVPRTSTDHLDRMIQNRNGLHTNTDAHHIFGFVCNIPSKKRIGGVVGISCGCVVRRSFRQICDAIRGAIGVDAVRDAIPDNLRRAPECSLQHVVVTRLSHP